MIPARVLQAFHGTKPEIIGTTDEPEYADRLPFGATEHYVVLSCPDCGAIKSFPKSWFVRIVK